MKSLLIFNHNHNNQEIGTYFAYNVANKLSFNNKRVLLLSTAVSFENNQFIEKFEKNKCEIETISPIKIYNVTNNLSILVIIGNVSNKINIKNILLIKKILFKQINIISNQFDYLVVDLRMKWNDLDSLFLKQVNSNQIINYYHFIENNNDNFLKKLIQFKKDFGIDLTKSPFFISNFDIKKKECMIFHKNLKQSINNIRLILTNDKFDNLIDFSNDNQWTDMSIKLSELVKNIE